MTTGAGPLGTPRICRGYDPVVMRDDPRLSEASETASARPRNSQSVFAASVSIPDNSGVLKWWNSTRLVLMVAGGDPGLLIR